MMRRRILKDKVAHYTMLGLTILCILLLFFIGGGLLIKSLPVILEKNLWTLLTTSSWKPFRGEFGFLSYILSTLYVTGIAILLALPLSLFTGIYLCNMRLKR